MKTIRLFRNYRDVGSRVEHLEVVPRLVREGAVYHVSDALSCGR